MKLYVPYFRGNLSYYIAQAAFWGWFSAQAIKFLWQFVRYRTLHFERLVGSGGFPSSHTSFVISTTAALYFKNNGITDIFVVALVIFYCSHV